jgi:hypothetical protein
VACAIDVKISPLSIRYIRQAQSCSKNNHLISFYHINHQTNLPSQTLYPTSNILFKMVRIATFMTAAFAGAAIASPTERRQASGTSDVVCGGLLQPLAGFLDYQSGNVGGNTNDILTAAGAVLEKSALPAEVGTILTSVTGGITASLVNGVTNILYGLSTLADNVDPECRQNAAYCTNELRAASAACSSSQLTQAQDACPQAKYTCARNGILTSEEVDRVAPCCAQFNAAS